VAWNDLIRRHLEPAHAGAADDLREARQWLRAILSTTSIILGPALQGLHGTAHLGSRAQDVDAISDADLRGGLVGFVRSFFRGLLLTIGALDVLERAEPPVTIVEWCALGLTELNATANAFRAAGIPVPADVMIPGYSASAWREHRQTQAAHRMPALVDFLSRGDACPPGVLGRIVEVMRPEEIWLFGSRARRTAGPESDWDLLVVVPDSMPIPVDNATWSALRDVRRQQIDLVPIRHSDFEADRCEFGTLAQIATTTGRRVYAA
jgi:predicted nucleotidyltransferase